MTSARPLPARYPEDVEHLDGAARGELRIPWCTRCGAAFWPPGPVCPRDFAPAPGWVGDAGTGTVSSWVRFHKSYFAGDEVPYVVVQVRLDSGPRITTTWTGAADPVVGEPVGVAFREVGRHPGGEPAVLPEFGPVDDAARQ
ncbi:Zn-ribbon domain-containing OB-fold protein [Pseudonocardia sp.]|uniref:Zn-ribbon domain-containing OB-fold protein n=1 Tax=Pseudonocardia sp. TaxID=60912 RepID=UPI003D0CA96E